MKDEDKNVIIEKSSNKDPQNDIQMRSYEQSNMFPPISNNRSVIGNNDQATMIVNKEENSEKASLVESNRTGSPKKGRGGSGYVVDMGRFRQL